MTTVIKEIIQARETGRSSPCGDEDYPVGHVGS